MEEISISKLQEYMKTSVFQEALGLPGDPIPELHLLGQGEYNRNYWFIHPVSGEKLVLRINMGSQMHLENQIGYEFDALKALAPSGRTPEAVFCDGSRTLLPYGVLVMKWLPGRALDYRTDLDEAAAILADIHSLPVQPDSHLLAPRFPLKSMYEECLEMSAHYFSWDGADRECTALISSFLNAVGTLPLCEDADVPRCMVNTELNSGNFLMNGTGRGYLVDWEKPLLSEPAQDLGHFLAPTTTFWKTDVILTPEEIVNFTERYVEKVGTRMDTTGLKKRLPLFLKATCLRGITWCSMAMVEYSAPDRMLRNEDTFQKIRQYLDPAFLREIGRNYIQNDFLGGVR